MCSEIAMNHKIQDSYQYDIELIALIYFAQVHNLTLNVDKNSTFRYKNYLLDQQKIILTHIVKW